jgi:uncharacterized protein (DUF952 family)
MRPTFHLVPADAWAAHIPGTPYTSPTLATEGFIHCTDGVDELIATANRYYRDDPRAFVALTIDLDTARSPWRIDDAMGIYPHVHGPIAPDSIVAVHGVLRLEDGSFTDLGSAVPR